MDQFKHIKCRKLYIHALQDSENGGYQYLGVLTIDPKHPTTLSFLGVEVLFGEKRFARKEVGLGTRTDHPQKDNLGKTRQSSARQPNLHMKHMHIPTINQERGQDIVLNRNLLLGCTYDQCLELSTAEFCVGRNLLTASPQSLPATLSWFSYAPHTGSPF